LFAILHPQDEVLAVSTIEDLATISGGILMFGLLGNGKNHNQTMLNRWCLNIFLTLSRSGFPEVFVDLQT
jgi:hypothetical protein